jgi:hypothetical protein
MKRVKVVVYSNDPRDGARPSAEYDVIAESREHATKLVYDQLRGRFPLTQLDATDNGDAPEQTTPSVTKVQCSG